MHYKPRLPNKKNGLLATKALLYDGKLHAFLLLYVSL